MKALAPSMDTIGLHGHAVDAVALLFGALTDPGAVVPRSSGHTQSRIIYFPGPHAAAAEKGAQRALAAARVVLAQSGFSIEPCELPSEFGELAAANRVIMAFESAVSLAEEYNGHRALLSPAVIELIETGRATTASGYHRARTLATRSRDALTRVLRGTDVLMTFSAPGEAPLRSAGTGDSLFNRGWTVMGVPCMTLPFGRGDRAGLPLGIQFVGSPNQDWGLLALGARIEQLFQPFNR